MKVQLTQVPVPRGGVMCLLQHYHLMGRPRQEINKDVEFKTEPGVAETLNQYAILRFEVSHRGGGGEGKYALILGKIGLYTATVSVEMEPLLDTR